MLPIKTSILVTAEQKRQACLLCVIFFPDKVTLPSLLTSNPRAIKNILARARQLVDSKKEDGFTALHLAALNNHKEVAEILIKEVSDKFSYPSHHQENVLCVSVGHLASNPRFLDIWVGG